MNVVIKEAEEKHVAVCADVLKRILPTTLFAKYFLTVDDFNPRARKLYESLVYRRVGELKDFYRDGVTSYTVMKAGGE